MNRKNNLSLATTCMLLIFVSLLLLSACGRSREEVERWESKMSDSVSAGFALAQGEHEKKPSSRRFIRTADLKFKVKDVLRTTYAIEEIAASHGGFVTSTDLKSSVDQQEVVPVSPDSSAIITSFSVSNDIILRVPNTEIDSAIKAISRHIDFLDLRVVKAEDVGIDLLANDLSQRRNNKTEQRLAAAINTNTRTLSETTAAEELLAENARQADEAKLSNTRLEDRINFSTINLSIYENAKSKKEVAAIIKKTEPYTPPFFTKLLESLEYGVNILLELILIIARLWFILLPLFIGWILIRRKRAAA